eukprot:364539-Chlamydomonas_euryale.AAC.1
MAHTSGCRTQLTQASAMKCKHQLRQKKMHSRTPQTAHALHFHTKPDKVRMSAQVSLRAMAITSALKWSFELSSPNALEAHHVRSTLSSMSHFVHLYAF